ncbi:MAG: CBS domain-containing protein, partial [Chthoniobacterales bacterium]
MNVTGTIEAILNQKSGEIWSVSPTATVYEAVAKMAEKNVGALVVMEGDQLVGILSERDYTRKVMLCGKRSRETAVSEIMSTELKTVEPKEGVDDCLRFMTEKRVRHLPVVA